MAVESGYNMTMGQTSPDKYDFYQSLNGPSPGFNYEITIKHTLYHKKQSRNLFGKQTKLHFH